ncbi:MAG: hypothetical protein HC767_15525 [Akkermansiaceae bacterium]|nr:hypothetical protein [Akkermansiaceae bacterium]
MKNLRTTLVPIGPFSFPAPTKNLEELRKELGIPQDAPLFLSFGHLRDNKIWI